MRTTTYLYHATPRWTGRQDKTLLRSSFRWDECVAVRLFFFAISIFFFVFASASAHFASPRRVSLVPHAPPPHLPTALTFTHDLPHLDREAARLRCSIALDRRTANSSPLSPPLFLPLPSSPDPVSSAWLSLPPVAAAVVTAVISWAIDAQGAPSSCAAKQENIQYNGRNEVHGIRSTQKDKCPHGSTLVFQNGDRHNCSSAPHPRVQLALEQPPPLHGQG